MTPQLTPARPVVLSFAEWETVFTALSYLPGVVSAPIIAAVQMQQQARGDNMGGGNSAAGVSPMSGNGPTDPNDPPFPPPPPPPPPPPVPETEE